MFATEVFWVSLLLARPCPRLESRRTRRGSATRRRCSRAPTYVPAILGTRGVLYGGLVSIVARSLSRGATAGMMMLKSLAIIVAFVTSWAGALGLFEVETVGTLDTHTRSCSSGTGSRSIDLPEARGALAALAELLPETARASDG